MHWRNGVLSPVTNICDKLINRRSTNVIYDSLLAEISATQIQRQITYYFLKPNLHKHWVSLHRSMGIASSLYRIHQPDLQLQSLRSVHSVPRKNGLP